MTTLRQCLLFTVKVMSGCEDVCERRGLACVAANDSCMTTDHRDPRTTATHSTAELLQHESQPHPQAGHYH